MLQCIFCFFRYREGQRRLDAAIDTLGRETVASEVARFRAALALARTACAAAMPPGFSGAKGPDKWQGCRYRDQGCAHECLDAWAARECPPWHTPSDGCEQRALAVR